MKISILVIAIVVGLVALIVALLSYFSLRQKFIDTRKLIKIWRQEHNDDKNRATREDINNLQKRIDDLESQLKGVSMFASKPSSTVSQETTRHATVAPIQKHLYAKVNSESYFPEVKSSKDETCVFDITLKSETEGEFNIISLDKLKQRDKWESVVEHSGTCTIEESQSYVVNHNGRCRKLPDEKWQVVEKLKITISK